MSPKNTTDHEEIRRWVESRGGRPIAVRKAGEALERADVRLEFPGQALYGIREEISWESFFRRFEADALAFMYQERAANGQPSLFHKFVRRDAA